jgi:hypothetical protein
MITECAREGDVIDVVAFGRWPAQCPELVAHAASCDICADVVEVARALHEDRDALCREAHPPAAGMVWWRATIRARAEAARTVTQPITIFQGVAGACIAGAAAGLITVAWQSWHWSHWIDSFGELALQLENRRAGIASASALASGHGLPILLAVAAGIVLAPLALYLTLADD